MATDWLQLRAGKSAWLQIKEQGLTEDAVQLLVGASGGPKWFVLQGLDRYLFGEFFAARQGHLDLLGTSAGAWRFAALGQQDPVAASELFCRLYSTQTYSAKPDVLEITDEARKLLAEYIPDRAVDEILSQDRFRHHWIVARCRGMTAIEGKRQILGLLTSAAANSVKRKWLGKFYERVIFHHPASPATFTEHWNDIPTRYAQLSTANFKQALLATGSIPLVLEGVRDIPGAPAGIYRDGGVTDYHFDLDFSGVDGLVLYPHFHHEVIPGWFDKRIKKRRTTGSQWPNVILLTPTQEFIDALPFGKIPDRTDFAKLDADARIKYWHQAVEQGKWMADQFHEWVATDKIRDKVELWT
ncbi:alpha/beta hydrolase [Pseudidiomarina halophila]|uniref:Alpha/beta hydrolase n=1 Tax=Pseudidiomarina halophila TaxID=1449799 RepID=A0A432Y134_9GAMM|nr:alpha/beta hydrolase [Pseudidiomarina halophila]RUO54669.1 alpha/beta hydrolase [Pseudidiomarina halophila]